jgi:hypothetical protein
MVVSCRIQKVNKIIMKKITRRNFLIIITTIIGTSFFIKKFLPFPKKIIFDKEKYFSCYCALMDSKKEFTYHYKSEKLSKKLYNQSLLGPYFVNSDEIFRLTNSMGKI